MPGYEAYLAVLEGEIQRMTGLDKAKELVFLSWEYLQIPDRSKSRYILSQALQDVDYLETRLYHDIEYDEDFRWALSDLLDTFGIDILEAAKDQDPQNFS